MRHSMRAVSMRIITPHDIDQIWQQDGLTIPKAGPNGSGLGSYPDLSAAIYRHVAVPGTFQPNGKLGRSTVLVEGK